jgi:restriction system protein
MELVFALDLVHPLSGVRKGGTSVVPSQEDLKRTMREKTDEELFELLNVDSRDYTSEAISAAKEELSRRQSGELTRLAVAPPEHSMVEGTPPSRMPGSARIEGLSGIEFEKVIATLLERMGFHAQMTKASGDGGIDIEATLDKAIVGGRYLFQCKRYGTDNLVGAPLVRDFYGAVMAERAVKGIFITTSGFTSQAREFAEKVGLELIDGVQLQRLLSSSGLAENCDLSAGPEADSELSEVERLTELAWRKQGDCYVLPVMREKLTLSRDLRDGWWVRGSLKGKPVEIHAQNLAEAFNAADRAVAAATGLVLRNAFDGTTINPRRSSVRWHDDKPTPKQLELCRKLGLDIPAGATRGMVSAALDAHFGRA